MNEFSEVDGTSAAVFNTLSEEVVGLRPSSGACVEFVCHPRASRGLFALVMALL